MVMPPKCQACLQGGKQRTKIDNNIRAQVKREVLKRNQLEPGNRVFSDQFISSVPGRNFTRRGYSQSALSYKGGTIFADDASSYISIHHQVGFTAQETIHSKIIFEREAGHIGNVITEYNTDNGVYTSKDFTLELERQGQNLCLSGVGAHHQKWSCRKRN